MVFKSPRKWNSLSNHLISYPKHLRWLANFCSHFSRQNFFDLCLSFARPCSSSLFCQLSLVISLFRLLRIIEHGVTIHALASILVFASLIHASNTQASNTQATIWFSHFTAGCNGCVFHVRSAGYWNPIFP